MKYFKLVLIIAAFVGVVLSVNESPTAKVEAIMEKYASASVNLQQAESQRMETLGELLITDNQEQYLKVAERFKSQSREILISWKDFNEEGRKAAINLTFVRNLYSWGNILALISACLLFFIEFREILKNWKTHP